MRQSTFSAAALSRCLVALLFAYGLSACDVYHPAGLNTVAPGDPYLAQLHAEYQNLAVREGAELDFSDADHFTTKVVQASKGIVPKMDAPDFRPQPKAARGVLKTASARLKKALAGGAAKITPAAAARAQAMYDCWLQEQEENYQWNHISRCRNGFFDAMDEIASAAPKKPKKAKKPKQAKKPTAPKPRARNEHYVYFAFDVAEAEDPFNDDILDLVAKLAKKTGDGPLRITGHADRAGPEKYNLRLSERRAINVKAALIERGIVAERMAVFSLGEHSPVQPTPDGERSDANRRVEILIQ